MDGKKIFTAVILAVIVIALFFTVRDAFFWREQRSAPRDRRGQVGLIYVEGPISGGRTQGSGLMASRGMDYILEHLREARLTPGVEAVVIRVNSPGGTASATQEIHSEILKIREEGKVVVVSMSDMAASGGYYLAAAADHIMANPGTTTGSIGVILQHTNLEELLDNIGVEFETIKSGEHKDMGDISRALTPEEREILQSFSQDVYEQFVEAVASGRNMSREQVLELADGRIFTGRQALELGLVDELGNLYDALDRAAELSGIEDPMVVEFGRLTFWDYFWGSSLQNDNYTRYLMENLSLFRVIKGVEMQ